MLHSITRKMLANAVARSWTLINTGERLVAASERLGADDIHAGFAELLVWRLGRGITVAGERLELVANRVAMLAGYEDGELLGIVAWPAQAQ